MLSKLDLKMYEILDEYVDKELKLGCFIKEKIGGHSTILKPCKDISGDWMVLQNGNTHYENKKNFDIIGVINLGTILQWIGSRIDTIVHGGMNISKDGLGYCISIYEGGYGIRIDITTPPLKRTDEQKQEFLDFALIIKNKEDEKARKEIFSDNYKLSQHSY